MRTPRHTITIALLAAAALTACSSDKPATTTAPTTVAAPAASTPGAPASDRLEALLVSTVPAGFVAQPDDVGDTGPSDLDKAIRDDGSPSAEALRSEGFVRGYQRLWIGPGDAEIIVFVYQFENEAGATADNKRSASLVAGEVETTAFTVDGIPGATAISVSLGESSAAIVAFRKGVFNVQVVANGPALAGLQARVTSVAQDQHDRL